MPRYEFRCNDCALNLIVQRDLGFNAPPDCPECHKVTRRKFSFTPAKVQHGGWDGNLGKDISGPKHFEAETRRKGEEQTERTGIPHSYMTVPFSDLKEVAGVTDEGLESVHREQVNSGAKDRTLWL